MLTPQQVLTNAIKDLQRHGYDSPERVEKWVRELSIAIERTGIKNDDELKQSVRASLAPKMHNAASSALRGMGISRFNKSNLSPRIYNELDRRILASTSLIKLNRTTAVNDTLQRFIGWSTSIPTGGAVIDDKVEVKQGIKKALSQLDFVERRVIIDQNSKLIANVNNIVAVDGGAVAVTWNSHWRQKNYDYRHNHKELDGKTFLIRDSWADKAGLVKGDYYEDLPDQFGQAIFCQCYGSYLFRLNRLPDDMLTKKGQEYKKQ
jgi:hypothetical protein